MVRTTKGSLDPWAIAYGSIYVLEVRHGLW